jgi:dolichol kinase
MSDLAQAAVWCAILVAGLGGAIVVKTLGLATTYVRDLLHVGAGIWVLGWPGWRGAAAPTAIVVVVMAGTLVVPWLARRVRVAAKLRDAVSNGEERWSGLERYTISYAVLTAIGLAGDPFPAAAALLALSLGDGVGGAVGRRFGRLAFAAPGGKRKTVEGSVTVAIMTAVAVLVAAAWLGAPTTAAIAICAGVVGALAEALAPRATDNVVVPAAVWLFLVLV